MHMLPTQQLLKIINIHTSYYTFLPKCLVWWF